MPTWPQQCLLPRRVIHKRGTMGKPDQKDLNENMAATQGLSHMITDCKKLFQVGGCGVSSPVLSSQGAASRRCDLAGGVLVLQNQCGVREGHPVLQWSSCHWSVSPRSESQLHLMSQAAGHMSREAVSILPPPW